MDSAVVVEQLDGSPTLVCALATPWLFAEENRIEFDQGTDFSRFKTFAWMPDLKPIPPVPNVNREAVDQVIREAIEKRLKSRELREAGSGRADLYVSYYLTIDYDYSRGLFQKDAGGARAGVNQPGPFPQSATSVKLLRRSELRVIFARGDSKKIVWEGSSVQSLENLKDLHKIARKQVSDLLDRFPP